MVGLVGNNGPMREQAALKAAHFVQMCDQRSIPIVFLQNTVPEDDGPLSVEDGGCRSFIRLSVW